MKKIYEAPTIEISEFEVEDIIMESTFVSLGEQGAALESEEYAAAVEILQNAGYTTIKRFGDDFKGWQ